MNFFNNRSSQGATHQLNAVQFNNPVKRSVFMKAIFLRDCEGNAGSAVWSVEAAGSVLYSIILQ